MISLFIGADVYVFRTDNAVLELSKKFSYFLQIINDLRLLLRSAADEYPAHDVGLDMEVFSASDGVHPNKGKLPGSVTESACNETNL